MIGNYFWGGGGVTSYQIEQSLRFDGTGRLSRSMGAGSRTTATISCWIKSDFYRTFFIDAAGGSSNSLETSIYMSTSSIGVGRYDSSWGQVNGSNRDPAAWYHVMWVLDTNNSTGSDRIRVYVNGVRRTFSFSTTPSQGENLGWNNSAPVYIGHRQQIPTSSGDYYWGYLAEMHHVDGTALDPTDFGEFDDNGVWRPIEVSGLTYGTNGFYLKFDPSATNGIGHDHSGNGNNFTPSGFTTSGTGTDVMSDTPTTNWCTLNPLHKSVLGTVTATNGNLDVNLNRSAGNPYVTSTIAAPLSGKWYWEVVQYGQNVGGTMYGEVGVMDIDTKAVNVYGKPLNCRAYLLYNGQKTDFTTTSSYGSAVGQNVVVGIALDMDNGKIWFSRAGVWQASGDPAAGTNAAFTNMANVHWGVFVSIGGQNNGDFRFNFGQHDLTYTPPTGFLPLNTANLPAPDIADGSEYFKTKLYTGDGSTDNPITGVGFQPDFVWIKERNDNGSHQLYDAVRGATKRLESNNNTGETTITNGLKSFDPDGFSLGNYSNGNQLNITHASWNWLAANGTSTPSGGTIASTVSANPTAGFSIVSYTGTGVNATVAHGLNVAPKMVIVRKRSAAGGWIVGHSSIGWNNYIAIEDGAAGANSTIWQDTAPTSTVFSVGTNTTVNGSSATFIAYCFAEVEGYSKFGSYTGNGTDEDGPFVYTGFAVSWLLVKKSSGTGDWYISDNKRNTYNAVTGRIDANTSDIENTNNPWVDFLSNGFKIRDYDGSWNASGSTFIYAAFAENPFGGSGVSPATAR